ncbi:hypothetical protein D9M68_887980 [compost metagenome]
MCGPGRTLAGIDKTIGGLVAGFAQQKETTAAEARAVRLDHCKGGADGHGRIEGIAAQGEGFLAGDGGGRMGAGDRGASGLLGCVQAECEQQE